MEGLFGGLSLLPSWWSRGRGGGPLASGSFTRGSTKETTMTTPLFGLAWIAVLALLPLLAGGEEEA